MAASLVPRSALAGARRLDAEYYDPVHIQERQVLASVDTVSLGDNAFITDGQHGYHAVDPASDVKHITAKCVADSLVYVDNADRLALETHLRNLRSSCETGDVILTTAGTIGNAGVVTDDILPANMDQDVARIKLHDMEDLDPWYVAALLNSAYGRLQTALETTGQVQGHLALEKVRTLRVPRLSTEREIANIARTGALALREARAIYDRASVDVAQGVGIDGYVPTATRSMVRQRAFVGGAGRLDPEYFDPLLDDIAQKLRGSRSAALGDLTSRLKSGQTPAANEYTTEGSPILKVEGLRAPSLLEPTTAFVDEDWAAKHTKGQVQRGDIAMLCAAHHPVYLGKAGMIVEAIPDFTRAVGELLVIRMEGVQPEFVVLLLNLPIVRLLVQRFTRGNTAHLYADDLSTLIIPIPDDELEDRVTQQFREYVRLRDEAREHLRSATRAVETAVREAAAA